MIRAVSILSSCGFVFAEEKFQLAQKIVFIVFLVDSTTMTVSFHPSGVAAYLYVLRDIMSKIKNGNQVVKEELEGWQAQSLCCSAARPNAYLLCLEISS